MLHESEPDNRKSIPKTLSKQVNKKQFDWKCLVGTTAVFTSLTATSLFLLGRTLSGVAEGPGLWTGNIHGVLNSQLLADPFTLVHFNHGIGLFLVLSAAAGKIAVEKRFGVAFAAEAVWEVVENTPFAIENFRQVGMRQGYCGDSVLSSIGDLGAAGAGFLAAAGLAAHPLGRNLPAE